MDERHRQAKRLPKPQPKPAAPPAPIAEAVVGEWTGGLASALRRARRDNIYDFAAYLGIGASTVDAWDKAPGIVPRSRMQKVLDRALEGAPSKVKRRFGLLARGSHLVEVPDSSGLDGNGGDTNRSQALKAIGSLLVTASVPGEVVERLVGDRAGRVDAGLLDSYERVARTLMAEYLTGDPRAVTSAALAHADDVLGLLGRQAADRRRLEALVVGVNARVGKWAFHDGDLGAAHKHLLVALGLAADNGDPTVLAQAIGASSILYSTLPWGGHGGDAKRAIKLLEQAVGMAAHADPHTRLWVATWHGNEAGAVEDVRACRASLDTASRAQELLADDPDAVSRIGPFSYGIAQQLESVRAKAEMLAGHFADADLRLDAVLRTAVTLHQRVVTHVEIGLVRTKGGEPDGACEALLAGLDLAEPAGYTMGVERARGVRARFPKPWMTLSCVRALDERLGQR